MWHHRIIEEKGRPILYSSGYEDVWRENHWYVCYGAVSKNLIMANDNGYKEEKLITSCNSYAVFNIKPINYIKEIKIGSYKSIVR